jgi:tetratricopeptide (TPR) repeat protein
MPEAASEGFDLDAAGDHDGEVILEIGGGATLVENEGEASSSPSAAEAPTPTSQLDEAENWKELGNKEFKNKNYLEAYDMYTKAIEVCPCPANPEDILRQRDEFEQKQTRARMEEEMRNRNRGAQTASKGTNDSDGSGKEETTDKDSNQSEGAKGPVAFQLEPQENGEKLAIFLNNRAAALIQLERFEAAIKDADVAILLNPKYTKAYLRRSSAFEKTERTEEALRDTKRALELEPSNATIRKSAARLKKIEDERLEKLKVRRMTSCRGLIMFPTNVC